jgi:hypothetical protein
MLNQITARPASSSLCGVDVQSGKEIVETVTNTLTKQSCDYWREIKEVFLSSKQSVLKFVKIASARSKDVKNGAY